MAKFGKLAMLLSLKALLEETPEKALELINQLVKEAKSTNPDK